MTKNKSIWQKVFLLTAIVIVPLASAQFAQKSNSQQQIAEKYRVVDLKKIPNSRLTFQFAAGVLSKSNALTGSARSPKTVCAAEAIAHHE
jgi:hypothetical protein